MPNPSLIKYSREFPKLTYPQIQLNVCFKRSIVAPSTNINRTWWIKRRYWSCWHNLSSIRTDKWSNIETKLINSKKFVCRLKLLKTLKIWKFCVQLFNRAELWKLLLKNIISRMGLGRNIHIFYEGFEKCQIIILQKKFILKNLQWLPNPAPTYTLLERLGIEVA